MTTFAPSPKRAKIPGPRGIPLLGNLFEFVHNPIQSLMDGTRAYGDLVRFHFGPLSVYLVNHPDSIQRVLQDHSRNYRKRIGYTQMRPLVGEGLLVSEGEFWLRQRRLIQPSFHRERIAELVTPMRDAIDSMLTRWQIYAESGKSFDIAVEMVRLTRAIIGRVLFGIDMTDGRNELVGALDLAASLADDFTIRLTRNPLAMLGALGFLPAHTPVHVSNAIRELDRVLYRAIAERRGAGSRADLVSMLLQVREEKSGKGMSDREVRDEALTIFLAGNETTAIALTWLWYLLARNPEAERRLDVELQQVSRNSTLDLTDFTALPYTRKLVLEAMRLYPPGWMIVRTAIEDDELGGCRIPAGSLVILSPYVTQRHPAFWKNPEEFDPERFSENGERPRYAYFPFGGGAHQCLGDRFGLMEAQLTVAQVAQKYRLALVHNRPIEPEAMITLRPRGGMPMRLVRK